jgi:hypothetical protein
VEAVEVQSAAVSENGNTSRWPILYLIGISVSAVAIRQSLESSDRQGDKLGDTKNGDQNTKKSQSHF